MVAPGSHLELSVEGEPFALPSRPATTLALVINELVQNAMEHAFVGRSHGRITVELGQEADDWLIAVRDDGVGLPDASAPQAGLQIAETLVAEDLHGQLQFERQGGTTATIRIPRLLGAAP